MSQSHNDNPFFGPLDVNPVTSGSVNPNQTGFFQNTTQSPPGSTTNNSNFKETVRNLQEICPSIDREIVEVILQNNDNDFEAALNELLALSDPSYNPVPRTNPTSALNKDQLITDEEYAKALQAADQPPITDQTKADEDYARALLAAEQGHIEDLERMERLSIGLTGARTDGRREPNDTDNRNIGLSNLMEKSKKKFVGLFSRNSKDSDRISVSDQPLTPNQTYEPSVKYGDDTDSLYDVHEEVILGPSRNNPPPVPAAPQTSTPQPITPIPSQPSTKPIVSQPANFDLLGDDPPQSMGHVPPHIPQYNNPSNFSASQIPRVASPPFHGQSSQLPQVQHTTQNHSEPRVTFTNNPFFNESSSNQPPSKNPFE